MLRTARWIAAALIAATTLGACGAERAAPIATRPPGPVTTTTERRLQRTVRSAPERPADRTPDGTGKEASGSSQPTETSAAATTSTVSLGGASDAAWAAFDEALAGRLIGGGDHAASVAIALHGEIVHRAAFGYRVPPPPAAPVDPAATTIEPTTVPPSTIVAEVPEEIEPGDRFRIASISKVITATVVLQLVEAGQIQLDGSVGEVLAAQVGATISDPAVAGVTVRQLLSHTSGFGSYQRTFFGGQADSCPAAARLGLSAGLASLAGTAYRYSNLNYCLLGLLVEQVAGRPYEAVVKDRLLGPLGIEGMRLAGTFDRDPAEVIHPSAPLRNYMEALGAAGSWVATPSDIVTIVDSLDPTKPGWHPLSPPLAELMRQPVPTVPYPSPDRWYGLGLMAFSDGSFGHTGTVESTHAMVVDRPDGVTWSVLVSGEYPWESGDLRGIVDRSLADAGIALS